MGLLASVADRVTGELEEDVLERRQLGANIVHGDVMLGQAVNHPRDEVGAAPADRDGLSVARDRRDVLQRVESGRGRRIGREHGDGALGTMAPDELGWRPDVDMRP